MEISIATIPASLIPEHLKLNVIPDKRRLITVWLISQGRPKYHTFYCIYCGSKVADLEGAEVYSIADVDDSSRIPNQPKLTFRCDGKYCPNTWFRFTLA